MIKTHTPLLNPMFSSTAFLKLRFSGVALALLLGIAAITTAEMYVVPVMLVAIVVGLVLHPAYESEKLRPGIEWCARPLLLTGVALLGFRVNFQDIAALSLITPLIALSALAVNIVIGCLASRFLGIPIRLAVLICGAVSICGASAAVAITSALPKYKDQDRDLTLTIAGVTLLSTWAMITYPLISQLLGHSDLQAGIFIGASIHDVAQVVGAGYSISDPAGNTATLVKLVRVSALLPVVIIISLLFRDNTQTTNNKYLSLIPPFLIVYLVIAALNSINFFPENIQALGIQTSKYCLIISLVAIGLKTNLKSITSVGKAPLALLAGTTIFLAMFCLFLINFYHDSVA